MAGDAEIPEKSRERVVWGINQLFSWMIPLVALERVFDEHFAQAGVAVVVWLLYLVFGGKSLVARIVERRRAVGIFLIAGGLVAIVAGTFLLLYQPPGSWFAEVGRDRAEARLETERKEKEIAQAETTRIQQALSAEQQARKSIEGQLADATRQRDGALRIAKQPPSPPPPEDQVPINWQTDFQLNYAPGPEFMWFRFIGTAGSLAQIKDAYITSALTGHRERLQVQNPANFSDLWSVDQIEPVASGALVILMHKFEPMLSLADLQSQWGAFTFHVIYNNKEYQRSFTKEFVSEKLARELPGVYGPRVTKKNGDK